MKLQSYKFYLTIIVFLFVLLFSCNYHENKKQHFQIFCYNEPSNITSLDPAYARSMANIWVVNQLFNGLVQLDEQLYVKPCIAKHWEISDDGTLYRFYLRTDVKFHEDISIGKERTVVAQDFVYSFNRILDPKVASPGTWIFQKVARDQHNQPAFYAESDSVFTIKLREIFPPFLQLLSMQYCSVVPHESVEFYGQDFRKHPVGTGPFKFQFWKENVKLVLVKNNHYFETDEQGHPLPYLDAINVTFIVDRQTAFLDFLKGNIHMISGIDASYKDALLNKNGTLKQQYTDKIYMQTQPFLNTEYLGFLLDENLRGFENPALQDVRVRQALNYCFDRKKMMRYLRNNLGIPGIYGFVPPSMPGFDTLSNYGFFYDPAKASQLLKEAGYPEGKGLQPIKLTTTANYLDLCQYIQHEAAKIGITIHIDVSPPATLREMIAKGDASFFRASWIADYPDAENYLTLFYSGNFAPSGPNYTRFSNAEFDKQFRQAITILDENNRYKFYRTLDSLVMQHAPVIVLYYDQVVRFFRNEVSGIKSNPMNLLTLKTAKLQK